jgi:hypothetical protein
MVLGTNCGVETFKVNLIYTNMLAVVGAFLARNSVLVLLLFFCAGRGVFLGVGLFIWGS